MVRLHYRNHLVTVRNLCFGLNYMFFSPQHCPDVSIPGFVGKRMARNCPDVSLKMVGVVAKNMPDKCPDISSTISCFIATKTA